MPVVPMFHAAAWGIPHGAVAAGAGLVLPGRDTSAPRLASHLVDHDVTFAAGVPTVWAAVPDHLEGAELPHLRAIMSGGSSVPRSMSERFEEVIGQPLLHAWGMTECSPMGCVCHVRGEVHGDAESLAELRTSVGLPVVGMESRIADEDDQPLPWDGEASGEFQVRGPWVAGSYHLDDRSADSFTADGWFRTGDVATIDRHGYIRLVDRTKDLVKSGGEWISSVRLENEIMAHPGVREAAVIAVSDPRWQERPLACVVPHDGCTVDAGELREFLAERVPRWWIPDTVETLAEIPKTATGKFSKRLLRERFADRPIASESQS